MQSFTDIADTETVRDSLALLMDNFKTLLSSSAGTSYPTADVYVGMLCQRTDIPTAAGGLYGLVSTGPDTWNLLKDYSKTATDKEYVDAGLATKQATVTGGASTIATSNLTVSRALASDGSGKVAVSTVTATEQGYLAGVTSAIQTQLTAKAATSHTHNDLYYTEAESDAKYLQVGRHTIGMGAGGISSRLTNGPSAAKWETVSNATVVVSLDFDKDAIEYAQFEVMMPKSWNHATTIAAVVEWTAASGSGVVRWGIRAKALSNDDAYDSAFGTLITVDDTLLTANDKHLSPETSGITPAGTPAQSDAVIFEIQRVATAAEDTLTVDARLTGIRLFLTLNGANDA